MLEIKPITIIIGVALFGITALTDTSQSLREPNCSVDIDELERKIDAKLIEQSTILGTTAVKKDSTAKVLTKVCSVLKTEVKELKFENKELKTNLEIASSKPADTIVIVQKVGLFGKIKNDTL